MVAAKLSGSSHGHRTNPLAIAALVCGIVQFSGLFFPAAIVAIILGHKAQRQIRRTGEDGYGLAKAGLILGYIGIVLMVLPLLILAFLSLGASGPGVFQGAPVHHFPS